MTEKIDHKTLLDFSKGKYSYRDYLKVKDWFSNIEENDEIKNQLFIQWSELTATKLENKESLNHIFEKIECRILREEKKQIKKVRIWSYYNRAAAILLIPVLVFSVWHNIASRSISENATSKNIVESWIEINAPQAARVEFVLPDGSGGWLNSGSTLKYAPVFMKDRKVELSGEAWFDVNHINNSEFTVSIADMDVKVWGTQFNVSAYVNDKYTDVTLEEGCVEIIGKTGVFQQKLSPNDKLSFNREERSIQLSNVDAKRFSAWKEGCLVINNEPLNMVIPRIERWYNVNIIINDNMLKNYRFKATFKDEPIEEVLRLIAKTTPIEYKIQKRTENKNGELNKRVITINLKK